jgi:hypothetical protein
MFIAAQALDMKESSDRIVRFHADYGHAREALIYWRFPHGAGRPAIFGDVSR